MKKITIEKVDKEMVRPFRTKPVAGHTFLAVGPMVWGRGKTVKEAVEQVRKAASGKKLDRDEIRIHLLPSPETEEFEPFVDERGQITYKAHQSGEDDEHFCPYCRLSWSYADLFR